MAQTNTTMDDMSGYDTDTDYNTDEAIACMDAQGFGSTQATGEGDHTPQGR